MYLAYLRGHFSQKKLAFGIQFLPQNVLNTKQKLCRGYGEVRRKKKRRKSTRTMLLYLKIRSVPRGKHSTSRLQKKKRLVS